MTAMLRAQKARDWRMLRRLNPALARDVWRVYGRAWGEPRPLPLQHCDTDQPWLDARDRVLRDVLDL